MVTLVRSDLEFIFDQMNIAFANRFGTPFGTGANDVTNIMLPWGVRTVSGVFNNLIPGQENFGAADRAFKLLTTQTWQDPLVPALPVVLEISDTFTAEGSPATFSLMLSGPNSTPTVFNLTAASGTATAGAGADFSAINFQVSTDGGTTWVAAGGVNGTQVTFAAGQTSLLVRVATNNDTVVESDETFSLSASQMLGGAVFTGDTGIATITPAAGVPVLTISDTRTAEGQFAVFSLLLSGPSATATVLNLTAVSGTAGAGADFNATNFEVSTDGGANWVAAGGVNGTQVTFAIGKTSLLVRVATNNDAVVEGNETFSLSASQVLGDPVVTTDTGIGTITPTQVHLLPTMPPGTVWGDT